MKGCEIASKSTVSQLGPRQYCKEQLVIPYQNGFVLSIWHQSGSVPRLTYDRLDDDTEVGYETGALRLDQKSPSIQSEEPWLR
ncbi:unnamed protein product [Protopolystoma xenopodis]|uniref:Uncharacterized protein n=1 Tax=Protopolystoma xenopodis TaxID=117903 RepID=A0A3S5AW29_9PLAT|nr:unnamed protein product [Protopolystoma xenopodis]